MQDEAIETVIKIMAAIRDWVIAVVNGNRRGLYLHGPSSVGKTTAVLRTLDVLGIPYEYLRRTLSPRGFFNLLKRHKDGIIILDDCLHFLSDKKCREYATTAVDLMHRNLSHETNKGIDEFVFNGRLILLANLTLPENDQSLAGFVGRCKIQHVDLTFDERVAVIRWLVTNPSGFLEYQEPRLHGAKKTEEKTPSTLTTEERHAVAEFVIEVYKEHDGLPSIRLYREYALEWYSLWKDKKLALHWKNHVRMEIEKDVKNTKNLILAKPAESEIAKEIDMKFKTAQKS